MLTRLSSLTLELDLEITVLSSAIISIANSGAITLLTLSRYKVPYNGLKLALDSSHVESLTGEIKWKTHRNTLKHPPRQTQKVCMRVRGWGKWVKVKGKYQSRKTCVNMQSFTFSQLFWCSVWS